MAITNRIQGGVETLQQLRQRTETVVRNARIDISGGAVDEVDPPSDIDEYWDETYQETGVVRANINQFISDVVEPGVRIQSPDDATQDYFMGGDSAPEEAPENGYLENCAVHAGERHQPFHPFLKTTIANRWVRGTALVELLKQDREDPESMITGFYQIRPETVYPQVYANKNILIDPDDTDLDGVELTPRGEAAAYIQFDDNSIIGSRIGGFSRNEVPLSQNDVMKQVLDVDIGGSDTNETGIFGDSIMAAIATDVEEYKQIKRDRHKAIQTKAYGIWLANYTKEVNELGPNEVEVVEWDENDQDDFKDEMEDLKPGEVLHADGPVDLEKFSGDVPDLESTLNHYVDDITAPLPAPKYSVGFEQDINQFVTERQETRYERLINEERRYQERKWTSVFREVARRHPDLEAEGLEVLIEPEEDDSPVRSLSSEEIEDIKAYAESLDLLAGPTQGPGTLVEDDVLRELVAQLPEDSQPDMEEPIDEADAETMQEFRKWYLEQNGGT